MTRPSHPTKAWELGAVARAAHEVSGQVPLSANPFTIRWQHRDWTRGWLYEDEQIKQEAVRV